MRRENDEQDLPIVWAHTIGTRDGTLTKDALMVNCFAENIDNSGLAIVKRPGTQYYPLDGGLITGTAQGQFAGPSGNWYIVSNVIYPAGDFTPGTGISIPSGMPGNSSYFVIGTFQANVPLATLQDIYGGLWTFNGTTVTKVTDANYISSLINQGMAYLDGVWYAMRANGQIIGSAINDPTTWPALDFVQSDVTYGNGIACHRHLNYVLAFYDQGLQVYWDANAAPNGQGIALAPVLNASFTIGCYSSQSIVELSDNCFWLSNTKQYGRQIQMMSGLGIQAISTPWVERILNGAILSPTSLNDIWAFGIELSGHQLYCLTLPNASVTLVYDVGTQVWSTWSSVVGGKETYFTGRFPIKASYNIVAGSDSFQDVTTGRPLLMSPTNYTDASGPINVTCITPPMDWGTSNYKRFNFMQQLADAINTSVGISYSDDDYQTFSTPRQMTLMGPRNQLRNCGRSRRRIWKMFHQDNTPLRLFEMRVDLDILPR